MVGYEALHLWQWDIEVSSDDFEHGSWRMKTMKSHGIDPDIVRQNRKQAAAVEQMAITLDILC